MNIRNTPLSIEAKAYGELKQRLQEAYDLEEDDPALIDTLDGESDLRGMIVRAIRQAKIREAYASGLSELMADNRRRQSRHEKAAQAIRTAVALAMEDAGMDRCEGPDLTITRRVGKPGIIVTDEALLPEWAVRVKREPNKAILNERYRLDPDHFSCPGVTVANGSTGISVTSK